MKNNFLSADNIYFRPYRSEDIEFLFKWLNDPETTYYMFFGQKPMTPEQIKEMMDKDTRSEKNAIFIVCDSRKNTPIAMVGLYDMHLTAHKAEMRIIIGETEYRGKGLGTKIVEMINFYGFDRLNLHRIYLGFNAENEGAKRAYEKAGYAYEGTLKEEIYRNSRYYDAIRMGILRDDYYQKWHSKHKKEFGLK